MKIQWIHQFGWQSNRKCLRAPICLEPLIPEALIFCLMISPQAGSMEYNMRKRKLSRILCESYSHFCPLNYIDRLWEEKTLLLASASGRRIPLWPTGRLGVGSTRSSWQPVDCLIGFPFRLYLDTIACFDNFGCSGLKETPDQNQVNRVVKITRPFSKSVKKRG